MLFETLDKLNIKYEYVTHKEVHTIAEADSLELNIDGVGTKSLFLKDNKDNYYLLIQNYSYLNEKPNKILQNI